MTASRPRIFVLGAGIVGLSTAEALVEAGFDVVVASEAPSVGRETTSWGAGGFWEPFHCEPAHCVVPWSIATLHRYLAESDAGDTSVERMDVVNLHKDKPEVPEWAQSDSRGVLRFEIIPVAELARRRPVPDSWRRYGWASVWRTVVVDPPRYLQGRIDKLQASGHATVNFGECSTALCAVLQVQGASPGPLPAVHASCCSAAFAWHGFVVSRLLAMFMLWLGASHA